MGESQGNFVWLEGKVERKMEGKPNGYQTSSFVADLFDVEESPLSSASGVLAPMFPSPQKVMLLFLNCSLLHRTLFLIFK